MTRPKKQVLDPIFLDPEFESSDTLYDKGNRYRYITGPAKVVTLLEGPGRLVSVVSISRIAPLNNTFRIIDGVDVSGDVIAVITISQNVHLTKPLRVFDIALSTGLTVEVTDSGSGSILVIYD